MNLFELHSYNSFNENHHNILRKTTFLQDSDVNYKLFGIKQLKHKFSISFQLNKTKEYDNNIFNIDKKLNESCCCQDCGGKNYKNRLISLQIKDNLQQQDNSPKSQNKQSLIESCLLTNSMKSDRLLQQSQQFKIRKSIKPLMKVIQAQQFMKKMIQSREINIQNKMQESTYQTNFYKNVENKIKSQETYRRSTNNTPLLIKNKNDNFAFPKLSVSIPKAYTFIQRNSISQISKTQQQFQYKILKSEKINKIKSLKERLLQTYLKDQLDIKIKKNKLLQK